MLKLSCILLFLLVTPLFAFMPNAQATEDPVKIGPCQIYTPAKFSVQFSFTQDISVKVSSVGQSLYHTVVSPQLLTFNTTASDQRPLNVVINYPKPLSQHIVAGIWSRDTLVFSFEYPVANRSSVTLEVKLYTSKAPEYPKP